MTSRSLYTPKDVAEKTFDFVVVGSGSSGSVVAARLAENSPSITVCLVEAGGHVKDVAAVMPLAGPSQLGMDDRDWQTTSEPSHKAFVGLKERRVNVSRGKCLGGSSILNFCGYIRGSRHIYDLWEKECGAKGWGWNNVLPLFKKSEDNEALRKKKNPNSSLVVDKEAHGVGGPLGVSSRYVGGPIPQAFCDASILCGFTNDRDYNAGDTENLVSLIQQTSRGGRRSDVASAYIFHPPEKKNLFIVTHAHATKLLLEKNGDDGGLTAVGVEVAGISPGDEPASAGRFKIFCNKEIVVSCGSIGSPHLLMLSGIGPRQELEKAGVNFAVDSPHVGKDMSDHPVYFVPFKTSKDVGAVSGKRAGALWRFLQWKLFGSGMMASSAFEAACWFKTSGFAASHPLYGPDAEIALLSSLSDDSLYGKVIGMTPQHNYMLKEWSNPDPQGLVIGGFLMQPFSKGCVQLESSDPFKQPNVVTNFLEDERDVDRMVEILQKCLEIGKTPPFKENLGLKPLFPESLVKKYEGEVDSKEFLQELVLLYVFSSMHSNGTCKIGKVVDERLRVEGVKGLRVADASIFPIVTNGHLNAACIMVGEKAAELIKEDHGLT